ncbi:MAG: flagellar hook-length control protein FliK, partial [SAR324 cluster bacterium]|nr:flagellar hook-length control protein FliK [SAR324 cluster bacterium]
AEVGDKLDQMQAVLKQQFRAENIDDVQAETQQEQILNAGLIKPGEQVQAAATRVPIESRIRIGSEQTESAFSLKSGLEPVPGLEPVTASNNFQSQLISKVEGAQQTQNNVQAPELPFDVEQVMGRVRVLRENDSQQITLRLQPDHLGQVTMKVRQTGGELQVDMRVDNIMAKQIIEAGFDTLKSRFLDQELAYDQLSLNIEVDQRSASQYDRDQQNSGFGEENASRSRGETEQETIPDPMNSRPIVNNDSALNIYV